MRHTFLRLRFLILAAILTAIASPARADFVTNHVVGGHGPDAVVGDAPSWGAVDVCCTSSQRWLGDVAGAYWAYPAPNNTWIRKSSAPNTYAVAYEFASWPYGRTAVVPTTWKFLGWAPSLITIQYDNPCPIIPGENTVHACSGDWTPIDEGGLLTYVIGNGLVKPGLPYGDYLHDTSNGGGAWTWCSFNFSDFPGLTKPPGVPNHAVAVDKCP